MFGVGNDGEWVFDVLWGLGVDVWGGGGGGEEE